METLTGSKAITSNVATIQKGYRDERGCSTAAAGAGLPGDGREANRSCGGRGRRFGGGHSGGSCSSQAPYRPLLRRGLISGPWGTDRQRGAGIRLRDELPNGRPPWKSRGVQDHAERDRSAS